MSVRKILCNFRFVQLSGAFKSEQTILFENLKYEY